MNAHAVVDPQNGRAMIFETDGKIFLLEYDKPGPIDGTGKHIGMYFGSISNRLEERDAGVSPYTELHEYLKLSQKKDEGVLRMIQCMGSDHTKEFRALLIEGTETLLADPEVRQYVLDIMLSVRLPKEADLDGLDTGHVGEIAQTVKAKWRK